MCDHYVHQNLCFHNNFPTLFKCNLIKSVSRIHLMSNSYYLYPKTCFEELFFMLHQLNLTNNIALEKLYNPLRTECQQITMYLHWFSLHIYSHINNLYTMRWNIQEKKFTRCQCRFWSKLTWRVYLSTYFKTKLSVKYLVMYKVNTDGDGIK